jgi:hypothetical protein
MDDRHASAIRGGSRVTGEIARDSFAPLRSVVTAPAWRVVTPDSGMRRLSMRRREIPLCAQLYS